MKDGWRSIQVERALYSSLQAAMESVRGANLQFREAWRDHSTGGVPAPDSNLQMINECRAIRRAQDRLNIALQRWIDFVSKGITPEDLILNPPSAASDEAAPGK